MKNSPVQPISRESGARGSPRSGSIAVPSSDACDDLPHLPKHSALPLRRTIRRHELHQVVPLAATTIYEMERRGEFPRRFNLTPRCVVWDLQEVEEWIEARKKESRSGKTAPAPGPDVKQRVARPVRSHNN